MIQRIPSQARYHAHPRRIRTQHQQDFVDQQCGTTATAIAAATAAAAAAATATAPPYIQPTQPPRFSI